MGPASEASHPRHVIRLGGQVVIESAELGSIRSSSADYFGRIRSFGPAPTYKNDPPILGYRVLPRAGGAECAEFFWASAKVALNTIAKPKSLLIFAIAFLSYPNQKPTASI